jgi:hypothetical protein
MSNSARRFAQTLVRQAEHMMPAHRQEWARAMVAEVEYLPTSSAALEFAAGCFWSALVARIAELAQRDTGDVGIGVMAGVFFISHAFIPESRSWPWIWPAVAGVLAAVRPMKSGVAHGVLSATKSGARIGATCGLLFLVGTIVVLSAGERLLGMPPLETRLGVIAWGSAGSLLLAPFVAAATSTLVRRRTGS